MAAKAVSCACVLRGIYVESVDTVHYGQKNYWVVYASLASSILR